MKKLFLLLMTVMLTSAVAFAQSRTVTGSVVYAGDDEPLAGATVQPVGGGLGVATDADGHFSITIPASVKKLTVSYIGMITQTVDITGQHLDIRLNNSENDLDEVMVVAYGTAKKSAFTGAASVVKADQLEDRMVSSATNALVGTVSGVQSTTGGDGQPGKSANILIRGIGSINGSTSPLYVLDGVPYSGDLSGINPADIESMTVLKDAAAAALYGARGANGVILITTKSGKEGSAKVTFDARWGSNSRQVKNYDVITDPRQYMEVVYASQYNAAVYNLGYTPEDAAAYASSKAVSSVGYKVFDTHGENLFTPAGKINPNATLGYSDGTYYYTPDNWADETFRNGLRQEYNLSISGGSDRFNYYINGSYLKDEGIIDNSGFERLSTRTSIDYQAKPWLKVGTNMSYSFSKSQYPNEDSLGDPSSMNAFYGAYNIAPIYPMYVRDADGTILRDANTGNPIYDYGNTTNSRRPFMMEGNPAGDLLYSTEEYLVDLFNGKWYAQLTPVEGLSITGNVNLMIDNTRYHHIASPLYGQNVADGGIATQASYRTRGLNLQGLANYRRTFADLHNTEFLLGYESYSQYSESLQGTGKNLYQPDIWAINNTLKDSNRMAYGSTGAYSTRGYFGRVNYDFDNRYYFSFSYRRDASSRFAKDNRWGSFFAVSAAWDAAKESFFRDLTWMDQLKLRASFGQQGNDGLGDYLYQDLYSISGSVEWSDQLSQKGNKDLTWEKTNAFNVGIDYSFLKGKVHGSVEYFSRQTSNMLFYLPASPSLGYPNIPTNFGSIRNYGVEFEVNYRPIETRDFTWDINLNATFINSKVIKLPEIYKESGYKTGRVVYEEGESLYQWYLVKYAGVDKTTGKALFWAWEEDENGNRIPGSDYVTDQYSTDFRQKTGDLLPTVYGGFGTSLKYKGFDLGLSFSYQLGGKIYDEGYYCLMSNGYSQGGSNWHKDILNAWTPANPNTNVPRLDAEDKFTFTANNPSDMAIVSSNYLALNNITFGYTLPASWSSRLKIDQIRIYGAADNVALWSVRKGLDPRQSFSLASSSYYTPMRCISGGIKVVF